MSNYRLGLRLPVRGAALQKHEYYVGASNLQTPGGVQSEMQRIDDDMTQFDKEIGDYVASQPGYPHSDPRPALEEFYGSVWSPFMQNWMAWYRGHDGWSDNVFWNNAPYAERALQQLIQLRDNARQLGMVIHSPDPIMPPGGVFDELGNMARGVGSFIKNVVYVVLFLIGGYLVIKVIRPGTIATFGPTGGTV